MTLKPAPDIKICGITDLSAIVAADEAGVHYLGFVFYPSSPRAVTTEDAAALAPFVPEHMEKVGLFVDAGDSDFETVLDAVPLDMLQLHGRESPERVEEIAEKFALPVIKAVHIGDKHDLAVALDYEGLCDFILFDTKVAGKSGGTGQSFDWALIRDIKLQTPWILSGGLNAANIGQAMSFLKPAIVDVSSGVEDRPGHKNPEKIKEFVEAALKSG